jgi:HAD superfamily hydrolase (TIGR01549 family)
MIKFLIFDMDGTIIDTDEVIYKTREELIKLYKPKGYKIDRKRVIGYSGPPLEESIADCFPEMDQKFIYDEYRTRTKKYYDRYMEIFPGCKETLEKFKKDGIALAVVTSKNREMTSACLARYDIEKLFSLVVTASDGFKPKPDPEGMNYVIHKIGVKKGETISIGDTIYDYLGAKNTQIASILLTMRPRVYPIDTKPLCFCKNYDELYEEVERYGSNQ